MKGADFVAVASLYTPTGEVLARPGERCDRVPFESLSWLERDGLIQVPEATKAKARKPAAAEGKE